MEIFIRQSKSNDHMNNRYGRFETFTKQREEKNCSSYCCFFDIHSDSSCGCENDVHSHLYLLDSKWIELLQPSVWCSRLVSLSMPLYCWLSQLLFWSAIPSPRPLLVLWALRQARTFFCCSFRRSPPNPFKIIIHFYFFLFLIHSNNESSSWACLLLFCFHDSIKIRFSRVFTIHSAAYMYKQEIMLMFGSS